MTTNPSTGLPEELEKIVQALANELFIEPQDVQLSDIRSGFRHVLDWACKEVCELCRQGHAARCGHGNERSWWHDIDGGHYECAASVLREGKS